MPNQRSIAAALGLTQATVARALQGSPLVKPETRRLVEETARKMGYHPNPMVTALMEHIRTGKEPHDQGSIAILFAAKSEADRHPAEAYKLQFDGLVHRAQRRGYKIECFYLLQSGMTPETIDRILYTRGFSGVILSAPDRFLHHSFHLKWDRYALATISFSWNTLRIDRVSSDHCNNVSLGFKKLIESGYERIGLVLPELNINPRASNWLAGYLANQQYLPKSQRLPLFLGSTRTTPLKKFRQWYERWKPDALLCLLGEELEWMKQMGLSPQKDLPLVCLNRPLQSDFSGVEENNFRVGEMACDIVVNHIIHNERGISGSPQLILVEGTWVDGNTLPDQKPTKKRSRKKSTKPNNKS